MLVFVNLKRQNRTLVHAANSYFDSKNNLCNYLAIQVFPLPPSAGDGGGGRKVVEISVQNFSDKDLEILTNDFNEISSLKSVITKST